MESILGVWVPILDLERADEKLCSQSDAFSDSPTYTSEQDNTIGAQGLNRGQRRLVIR